jgi:hypothetical protein
VQAQEMPAMPAPACAVPLAGSLSAFDPLLKSSFRQTGESRPGSAGPAPAAMPAFVPQAAAPRYSSELAIRALHTSTAIPASTAVGFAWTSFAAITPAPAEQKLRPITPAPQTAESARVAFRGAELAISGAGMAGLQAVVPLDVYVQRVKAAPKKECEWKTRRMAVMQPAAMPGVWPARFEQLVLQDWRRRYPARQVAVAPAPITTGTRVRPMTQHLNVLASFRQNAPHFVKGLAAAAFVGAILWLSWSTESVRSSVTADRHWIRTAISKRAAMIHDDNFRAGMNLWEGRKNWAQSWSYSADGFIRTGQLALYRPTLKMDNYRLEFFGQIESKSLGWVFRAKDEQNYYAMKLSVTEPGPRPLVSVVRYPVLNGQKGKRVQIPLPIMMHNNTPYHVALDVKGNRFRAFVEDQEVDSWNDDKLRAGGVGFFSETGEHARLYWVKVSHNTDWLGRLCGMLSGNETSQDSADLWNPAEARTLAMLDRGSVMDGAKNVDRRRGVPMAVFRPTLPVAAVFVGDLF